MTRLLRPIPLGLLFVLLQLVFVFVYLDKERSIVFWDYAMYANMAIGLWSQPTWSQFWSVFTHSFAENYNFLFTLPSLLSFALLGPTREIFILTNTLIYMTAHQLAVGFVLSRLFSVPLLRSFLLAMGLSFLVPFMWYPLLQGYPDNGAAALLMIGLGLLVSRDKQNPRTALLTGVALGLAIVFRRHYAYPVLALLFAHSLWSVPSLLQEARAALGRTVKKTTLFYGTIVAGLVGMLAISEPSYLATMVTTDFGALYKSYERPPLYFAHFALAHVGGVLLVTVLLGYGWIFWQKPRLRAPVGFDALVTLVWVFLWAFGPGQAGAHYLISLLPLFCVVGLYALFHWAKEKKLMLFGGALFLLGVNSAYALWFAPHFLLPSELPRFGVFSAQRPPWVRSDMEQLLALARHVRDTTTESDRIAIAGSSFIFNQDLVRALFTDHLKDFAPAHRFVFAPESDGQQGPPLDAFATANIFLVARPTQYHLAPEGQKVVAALADSFPPAEADAPNFTKDAQSFSLEKGVRVDVWRKKNLPPSRLHENLKNIRRYKDSGQLWVAIQTDGQSGVRPLSAMESDLIAQHGTGLQKSGFFFDAPITKGKFRFVSQTAFTPECSQLSAQLEIRSGEGKLIYEKESFFFSDGQYLVLPFEAISAGPSFATIKLKSFSNSGCSVALKQLRLEQIK